MQDLQSLDKKHLWHPFTQMKDWLEDEAIFIESGQGVMLRDTQGKEYIDGVSSLWCNVHGHRRKEIDDAIRQQLEKIAHSTLLGLASPSSTLLAAKLVDLAPEGLSRVFYSDSGSTAVEIALKIALQYWQQQRPSQSNKSKFVCLPNAYHGDTVGAVSVGGIDLFHKKFGPLLFETLLAPSPYGRPPKNLSKEQRLQNCIQGLENLLKQNENQIAGMILEPLVQGAGGMLMAPIGYLRSVRELCTKYKILMIVDEVAVGFGRTGRMFACEHEDISPDLMALGKGLTGGYLPLAATLATQEIFDGFLGDYQESRTFFHGHTFTGNPLACAAAIASLDIFEKDEVIEKLSPKIQHFQRWLIEKYSCLPHVGEVRQIGLMAGIELVKNSERLEAYPSEKRIGALVCREARNHGILIRPLGDVIVIMPPLSITMEELDRLLDGIYLSIKTVTETKDLHSQQR